MLHIQCLNECDFAAVEQIFIETFPRTDDADFVNAWRTKECNWSLGLYYNATLVGFAITCKGETSTEARLWFIAVCAKHRAGGAGTRLLTAVMSAVAASNYSLQLTPDNCPRIINWYKRHGFVITKTMPFVHRDIPTCWMEWVSPPSSPTSLASTRTRSNSSMDEFELAVAV